MIKITAMGAAHANFSLNNLKGVHPFWILNTLIRFMWLSYNCKETEAINRNDEIVVFKKEGDFPLAYIQRENERQNNVSKNHSCIFWK